MKGSHRFFLLALFVVVFGLLFPGCLWGKLTVDTGVVDAGINTLPPVTDESLAIAYQMVEQLSRNVPKLSDYREILERYEGKTNLLLSEIPPPPAAVVGAEREFWVRNADTHLLRQVRARLVAATERATLWVQSDLTVDLFTAEKLVKVFSDEIYPTNTRTFGVEWSPGVDGDARVVILYATDLGKTLAGYFSSVDEYPRTVVDTSNAAEMFLINASTVPLNDPYTLGVLAHEHQHMIHWYADANEEGWLSEGLAELAGWLNGYHDDGFVYLFALNPDIQLNDWSLQPQGRAAHYGASFLFMVYLKQWLSDDGIRRLVVEPLNGLQGIDATLVAGGKPTDADTLFADWVVTNYIHSLSVDDEKYTYPEGVYLPSLRPTEVIRPCDGEPFQSTVHQYGADYLLINCPGTVEIQFQGDELVNVVPVLAHSGEWMYWSGRVDEADAMLKRQFDLRNVEGNAELTFWTWYELEEGFDYLYVVGSLDGERWQIIPTSISTVQESTGNNLGGGITGSSGQWVQVRVDLTSLAGNFAWIGWNVLTDTAILGEGVAIDDIEINAIGYKEDFEQETSTWIDEGFIRLYNLIPQTYRVHVITLGDEIRVIPLALDREQIGVIQIGRDTRESQLIVAISGTTRFTRQLARYSLSVHSP